MRRHAIGLLAIVLLVCGPVILIGGAEETTNAAGAVCLRVGVMLALAWLAEPQLRRLPTWLPFALLGAGLLVAVRPRLLPFALIAVILLWFVRPRA